MVKGGPEGFREGAHRLAGGVYWKVEGGVYLREVGTKQGIQSGTRGGFNKERARLFEII